MENKEIDIYDICLGKKSLHCIRRMGEETCSKCKTYKMYKLGLAEGKKQGYELGYNEKFVNTCMKAEDFDKYLKLVKENEELKAQIEKMKQDQKTAFWKGMRHFANAIKKYDSKNGAATDYLENTVNIVFSQEACNFCKHRKIKKLTSGKTGYICDRRVCTGICFEGKK